MLANKSKTVLIVSVVIYSITCSADVRHYRPSEPKVCADVMMASQALRVYDDVIIIILIFIYFRHIIHACTIYVHMIFKKYTVLLSNIKARPTYYTIVRPIGYD